MSDQTTTSDGFPKPRQNPGGEPCGECHLKPGETCDICGAVSKTTATDQIVTYDPERGLSYIYLAGRIAKGAAKRQVCAGPNIILDFDAKGRLLGVELLDRRLLHPALLARAVAPGGPEDA